MIGLLQMLVDVVARVQWALRGFKRGRSELLSDPEPLQSTDGRAEADPPERSNVYPMW